MSLPEHVSAQITCVCRWPVGKAVTPQGRWVGVCLPALATPVCSSVHVLLPQGSVTCTMCPVHVVPAVPRGCVCVMALGMCARVRTQLEVDRLVVSLYIGRGCKPFATVRVRTEKRSSTHIGYRGNSSSDPQPVTLHDADLPTLRAPHSGRM